MTPTFKEYGKIEDMQLHSVKDNLPKRGSCEVFITDEYVGADVWKMRGKRNAFVVKKWWAAWDSNPRPQASEACTLSN
jgi:hypothetical protein